MTQLLRHWRLAIIATLGGAAIFALAACGDDGGTTVSVELSEFNIVVDPVSVQQGNITWSLENVGDLVHELVLIRTDLAPDALPLAKEGGIDETQVEIIGRVHRPFEPGSATATFHRDPSNYVLACNIVDVSEDGDRVSHYENGMRTAFTVTE